VAQQGYPIVWVDREGKSTSLLAEPGVYANPRLSPDSERLSLTVLRDGDWDNWVHDLGRGISTRLTFEPALESEQIWSPDGQQLVFSSNRSRIDALYRKRADGSGDVEQLTKPEFAQWAASWSRDGRYLA
jgi:Tol biopolymer transport system component